MVPHSRCRRIRQSPNILGDCSVRRLRKWGTMAATVDHSSHDASMDFLFLLWAVSYVGIRKVSYQTIGDTLPDKWGRASSPALEPSAWQPLSQISHGAALSGQGHHEGMMCGGGGGKIGGKGEGGDDSSMMQIFASIDHGGWRHPTAAMEPRSRQQSIQQSTRILFERTALLKLEKNIVVTIFMTILGTTRQQIVVPDRCRSWWPYGLRRALAATIAGHILCICPHSWPVCLDWHIGHGRGLGRWWRVTTN